MVLHVECVYPSYIYGGLFGKGTLDDVVGKYNSFI